MRPEAAGAVRPIDRPRLVLGLICAEPGLRTSQLMERTGLGRSAIATAVAKLRRLGLVHFAGARRTGGYHVVELNALCRAVLATICERPGLRTAQLGQPGTSRAEVADAVGELVRRAHICFVGPSRTGGYHLDDGSAPEG